MNPAAVRIAAPFVVLWVLSPVVARWVSLPPDESIGRQLSPADAGVAPPHRPSYLAVLRDLRRPRGPRPPARQLPGRAGAGRRPPDVAHEHRAVPAVDRDGPRPRLDRHDRHGRATGGDARDDRPSCSGSTGTSTTGTTPATSIRSSPRTCRRSTAATCAAHLLAVSNACREMLDRPLPVEAALAGHRRRGPADARGRRRDRRRATHADAHTAAPCRGARTTRGTATTSRRRAGRGPSDWPSSPATPGRSRRGAGPDGRAWRGDGRRAGHLGRGGRPRRREPCPGPRAARAEPRGEPGRRPARTRGAGGSGRPVRHPSRCLHPDVEAPATVALTRRLQAIADRAQQLSRRRTSASCSTRPASCSRSASGSGTGHWIRATTTCSRRRPASPASSRSPRATSTPSTGSGSVAR